jgi:hypothetical protein
MATKSTTEPSKSDETEVGSKLCSQYECGLLDFAGTPNALYERQLMFDNLVDVAAAGARARFEALATRAALDLISCNHFSRSEPGIFTPLYDTLLTHGDYYMHLADLGSYLAADQRLTELYADRNAWASKVILNVAGSGKFSSDRTIREYANDIWEAKPCPVP